MEYDAVILMLDILLLRIQSYRHMIFNYDITSSVCQLPNIYIYITTSVCFILVFVFQLLWRLGVVLVLCEAYIKMRLQQLATEDFILLQLHFHLALVHAIVGKKITL